MNYILFVINRDRCQLRILRSLMNNTNARETLCGITNHFRFKLKIFTGSESSLVAAEKINIYLKSVISGELCHFEKWKGEIQV